MAADISTLLHRATLGQALVPKQRFRPAMARDPFWIWCHYHGPTGERFDETNRFDAYRMNLGIEWDRRYITQHFPDAYRVQAKWSDGALQETLQAMLRGERAIQGAVIWLLGEDM